MKTKIYALLSLFLILTACEKEVEFNAPDVETASDVTINAIAIEGEPFRVYLNKAYSVGKAPLLNIGYGYALSNNDAIVDYQTDDYYKRTAICDADIQVIVNGQQIYNLALDSASSAYTCDYYPQVGDQIKVETGRLQVETTVPPSPKLEVLDHEVLYANPYKYMDGMAYETDTLMRITCRIQADNANQYYRLRVRGVRKNTTEWSVYFPTGEWHIDYAYYPMQDIFFSEDGLFVDNRLSSGFGGWPAYFSNIFNNTAIGGNSHTFIVYSPKPPLEGAYHDLNDVTELMEQQVNEPDVPAQVMVELQALSPELYHYLKSVELFRITENDAFSEPVQIYSNVQNGWGILGSLSYDRHFVEYGE